jgi:hypothetical protein
MLSPVNAERIHTHSFGLDEGHCVARNEISSGGGGGGKSDLLCGIEPNPFEKGRLEIQVPVKHVPCCPPGPRSRA